MDNSLQILSKYLGEYEKKKDENYAFHCPFCKHHKKKLEIDIQTGLWNCWVCSTKGIKISNLLKKLKANTSDIKNIKENYGAKKERQEIEILTLPDNFDYIKPYADDLMNNNAYDYLKKRGLTDDDIIKYKIGYCTYGNNVGEIILPSYDSQGKLNYYIHKNIYTGRYKNPNYSKNQLIFDVFVNWNEPIVLVEGMFDAISVKHNSVPLLGKFINKTLKKRIIKSTTDTFYICLDSDAYETSLEICKYLISIGKKVFNVVLPKGEDPSSLGYKKVWEIIKSSKQITERDIFSISILKTL
jgi:DNA primase